MATKKRINYRLLRKCQDLFKRKPQKAYMDGWVCDMNDAILPAAGEEVPICKTHCCIGGSALLLSGTVRMKSTGEGITYSLKSDKNKCEFNWLKEAKKVLGLTQHQAIILFNEGHWPAQFQSMDNDTGSRTLARNMVKRIDHFIKTKGME